MHNESGPPMLQNPIVTIDGPSGAGKGTIAKRIATKFGYKLLDSGALYRLTALSVSRQHVDIHNEVQVARVAEQLDVQFEVVEDGVQILLAGDVVTTDIREESVGMNASVVAAYPLVRQALLQRQRDFASTTGLVADGRDMGTVVFPGAQVKVFLTASAEVRAKRRVEQLKVVGQTADYLKILADIQARDERDSERSAAPLKPADDAVLIDSSKLNIDQVVDQVSLLVKQAI